MRPSACVSVSAKSVERSLLHALVALETVRRANAGRKYAEGEVNALIARAYPDYATLRRELYDNDLLDRADGTYWRTEKQ
ncbi:MAG: DUF2087 domain-containing protein [Vulcanimicrobiaceae bacterium]